MTYSHRNGETELPTEEGRFWLKGNVVVRQIVDEHIQYASLVSIYKRSGWRVILEDYGSRTNLKKCDGQWWGPIVPPWDELEEWTGG